MRPSPFTGRKETIVPHAPARALSVVYGYRTRRKSRSRKQSGTTHIRFSQHGRAATAGEPRDWHRYGRTEDRDGHVPHSRKPAGYRRVSRNAWHTSCSLLRVTAKPRYGCIILPPKTSGARSAMPRTDIAMKG